MNESLIAAAPELLAVLRDALSVIESEERTQAMYAAGAEKRGHRKTMAVHSAAQAKAGRVLAAAYAAIAKAEGRGNRSGEASANSADAGAVTRGISSFIVTTCEHGVDLTVRACRLCDESERSNG